MSVLEDLDDFYKNFNGNKFSIGKTVENRDIYCFKVSKTDYPIMIIQSAIHAREFITTYLTFNLIEDFLENGLIGTAYFLPAINLDGINICQTLNPLYKANARGVDLNVNFDARWGTGEFNQKIVGAENFIGAFPFSEPETRALRDFTLKIKPNATVSFHSKGEEIYYEFFQKGKALAQDEKFAKTLAQINGYKIKSTPNSAGGYKDWCVEKLKISALTVEVGSDLLSHPIGKEFVQDIFLRHKGAINALMENLSGRKIKNKIHENRLKRSVKGTK